MTSLHATSEIELPAEDNASGDARALLGHLQLALAEEPKALSVSEESLSHPIEHATSDTPSFGRAVARQADLLQQLVEQIDRLDNDQRVAVLQETVREICVALNDVVLQARQNASDVSAK